MAIPKNGSRRIVVDGENYLWRVRRKRTYHRPNALTSLVFCVQHEEKPGANLIVEVVGFPQSWFDGQYMDTLSPRDVAGHIQAAVSAGWKPLEPGKPFLMNR